MIIIIKDKVNAWIKGLLSLCVLLFPLGAVAQNYHPSGQAFVCSNGQNRYTRALYGSHTEWRVETSDRPVFALYKKRDSRNVRLRINDVALDSTTQCDASYEAGMRGYIVRDKRWGVGAIVRIKVVASLTTERALWRIQATGFKEDPFIDLVVSNIRNPKLHRNGDIGVDAIDAFEADGKQPLQFIGGILLDNVCYLCAEGQTLKFIDDDEGERLFEADEKAMKSLAGRIEFRTPDPYINTLGGALVVAADGNWDGETWLHGCIGWRMPLAGWRAGYLGDVLGWPDRAISHFDAYSKSQVRNVSADIPHPTQDPKQQMARSEKRWHTQMYSDGYICRNPNRNDQMHHYDMNLNYIDELLWHFQYDADKAYLKKMWPVLKSHLAWEKRNFDPDGDHLYDAYCCIWASDALYYSGGAVTHSSAYNYRGNRLAARIAQLVGEDPQPYRMEADAILKAMNDRLWLKDKGYWAEYQDLMGLKRVHESAAVWSIYTPIDCGACSAQQAYQATKYIDSEIPHIPVANSGYSTISTSNWMPYSWSINNVAAAEVMHTALAYFVAGRNEEGFRLMKANILDQMYYGRSPGNFGQISTYDAARGECYRDFGDCIGISARTLIQGLFGIQPRALFGDCVLQPGFPESWDSASVHTPYLDYSFRRNGDQLLFDITQHFAKPLKIMLRINNGLGQFIDVEGNTDAHQVICVKTPVKLPEVTMTWAYEMPVSEPANGLEEPEVGAKYSNVSIDNLFNANVPDIFKNEYRSPRPPYTTLQIPLQGVGEWCHPQTHPDINDSVFRALIVKDVFSIAGVPFRTPAIGHNIIYTSLWDNYPNAVTIPINSSASKAWLLMTGSTNHMQCRIANGIIVAQYKDGTSDSLQLVNPDNWCPIERDYYVDGKAFHAASPRPYRVALSSGMVSRDLGKAMKLPFANAQGGELGPKSADGGEIPGGAAQLLCLPLDSKKKVVSLTLRTLSNDVVIGLMAVTLQR